MIDGTTLAPLLKYVKGQIAYIQDEPVEIRNDKVDKGGEYTTTEQLVDGPCEYEVDRIVVIRVKEK